MSNDIRDMIESRRHVGVNTSAESFQKRDPRIELYRGNSDAGYDRVQALIDDGRLALNTETELDGPFPYYDEAKATRSADTKEQGGKEEGSKKPKMPEKTTPKKASASDPLLEAIHQMRYGESFEKSIADRSLTPTLTQLKDYVNGKQLTPGERAKLTQDIAAARQVQSNANMKSDSLLPEDQAYMSGFSNPKPSAWDYLDAKKDARDARNDYQRARDQTYLDPTNTSNQGPIDIPGANALLDDISMNVNDQVNKRPMEMAAATQGKLDGIHDRYDRSGRVSDPNKPLAGKLPKRQPPKKDEPTTPKKASASDPLLEAIHQMRYGESFQKRDPRIDVNRKDVASHHDDQPAYTSARSDVRRNDSNQIEDVLWDGDPRRKEYNVWDNTDLGTGESKSEVRPVSGRDRFEPLSPGEYTTALYNYHDNVHQPDGSDLYDVSDNSTFESALKHELEYSSIFNRLVDSGYFKDEDQINEFLEDMLSRVGQAVRGHKRRLNDSTIDDARAFGRAMGDAYKGEEEPVWRWDRNRYQDLDDLILHPRTQEATSRPVKRPAREHEMWRVNQD